MEKEKRMNDLKIQMKSVAEEINKLTVKRNLARIGKGEYQSEKPIIKLQQKFARLQREHKKLYFS